MGFFKRLNPVPGAKDFWHEFRRPNPHRWKILGASVLITGTLFYSFASERTYIPPPSPEVTYITSYAPDRSDAEIIASNEANQLRKDENADLLAERAKLRRDLYRALGQATGIDTEKIETEAAQERAREQAEAQRIQDELMGRPGDQPGE